MDSNPRSPIRKLAPDVGAPTIIDGMRPRKSGSQRTRRWRAGELVRRPVDVIVTDGQISALVAHEATRTIPIVGGVGSDPVTAGLVRSSAHPGGNVTGFSPVGAELSAKRLQLLKETIPAISRIAALWNPAEGPLGLRSTEEAAGTPAPCRYHHPRWDSAVSPPPRVSAVGVDVGVLMPGLLHDEGEVCAVWHPHQPIAYR
jgi:hypothetical protein